MESPTESLAESLIEPLAGSPTGSRRVRWSGVALCLLIAACSDSDRPLDRVESGERQVTGEGVLVVVVDGLRWDHTSLSGYDRDTTPFLTRFASRGVTFTDAWSPAPSLVGSHVAILSGCDPSLARPPGLRGDPEDGGKARRVAASEGWIVPPDLELLGRPFLGAGWDTAAFVDDPMIAGLRGFDRGFRSFVEFGGAADDQDGAVGVVGVGRRFLRWLNRLDIDDNWFAYVHMNDLERVWATRNSSPFAKGIVEATSDWKPRREQMFIPPVGLDDQSFHSLPPSRASHNAAVPLAEYELRYDRGIRAVDASLARIIGHVEEFDRADNITIVVVGSFGMGLGENGLYLQAGLVEEEDLHVPLVIRPSSAMRKRLSWGDIEWPDHGRGSRMRVDPSTLLRTDALVSLIDLAPTLVDLHELRSAPRSHGLSLRPLMEQLGAEAGGRPDVAARQLVFAGTFGFDGQAAIGKTAHYASYGKQGDLAGPTVGPTGGVFRSRMGTVDDSDIARRAAEYQGAVDRWQSLLLDERSWLHFGVGEADDARLEEIRRVQLRDPVPQ